MEIQRIVFEYPENWLEDLADPICRMHAECYRAFQRVSARLGLEIVKRTSLGMADFAPRVAEEGTLLVSMHTVGVYPNVARLKEAYLPDSYYLDRTGFSGWAEMAFNGTLQERATSRYAAEEAGDFVSNLRSELLAGNRSKYPQSDGDLSADLERWGSYIFLPLQVVDDIVAHLSRVDQFELVAAVARAGRDQGRSVVVKLHPMGKNDGMEQCVRDVQREFPNVHVTAGSVLKIARHAVAVVTVNSGVGFESLVLGTPVVSVGRSDYSFLTAEAASVAEIAPALSSPSVDWHRVNSFLKFFVEDYTFSIHDDASLERLLRRWLEEDHRSMRNLRGVSQLTDFFQRYHRDVRSRLEGAASGV